MGSAGIGHPKAAGAAASGAECVASLLTLLHSRLSIPFHHRRQVRMAAVDLSFHLQEDVDDDPRPTSGPHPRRRLGRTRGASNTTAVAGSRFSQPFHVAFRQIFSRLGGDIQRLGSPVGRS